LSALAVVRALIAQTMLEAVPAQENDHFPVTFAEYQPFCFRQRF
jgi:hypothetical protein